MTDRENRFREVERYLYRLVAQSADQAIELMENGEYLACNLRLNVHEVSSWIIKFQPSGQVMFNNCESIMTSESIQADASISFMNAANFWATINGKIRFDEGVIGTRGSSEMLKWFKQCIFATSVEGPSRLGIKNQEGCLVTPPQSDKLTTSQLIVDGSLIKKRDLMNGWKSRYVKVYIGRFEYFASMQDDVPRAVIPLLGATVSVPREMRNRDKNKSAYYQIVVQPKYHEKSFKFMSRLEGVAGQQELWGWVRAFRMAAEPAEKAKKLLQKFVSKTTDHHSTSPKLPVSGAAPGALADGEVTKEVDSSVGKTLRRSLSGTFSGVSGTSPMQTSIAPLALSLLGIVVATLLSCMSSTSNTEGSHQYFTTAGVSLALLAGGYSLAARAHTPATPTFDDC